MNNKRKNRQGPPRSPRGRVVAEGVYNNAHFMHAATSHVGDIVQVLTQSGSVWEGVFKTFSAQFEVVLEVAHRVDQEGVVALDSVVEKLIFKPQDVVSIRAKDSDLEYATHDVFQTDSAISSKFNGNGRTAEDRHLEPWDGCEGDAGDSPSMNGEARLDELELERANGWDANDMFRKNEEVYGVHSTYDHSLAGYTLPLQRKDTQDYRDAEAKAEEIAAEIENTASYKARIELENGDEEEKYAAVVRPQEGGPGKYVIPNKRKNMQTGKLVKPTERPSNNGGSSPSTSVSKPPGAPSPSAPYPPLAAPANPAAPAPAPAPPKEKEHRMQRPHITPPNERRQEEPTPVVASTTVGAKSYAAQAGGYHAPPFASHAAHPPPQPAHAPQPHPPPNVNGEPRAQPHPRQGFPPHHHHNPPPPPETHGRPPRHHAPPPEPRRQDEVQELRKFGAEFILVTSAPPQNAPQPPAQNQPPPPGAGGGGMPRAASPPEVSANVGAPSEPLPKRERPPKQHTPPEHHKPQPPPQTVTESPIHTEERSVSSASPPSSASPVVERMANTLKKSTLNPNAKEFNPAAKPFTQRSPSTPNPSRPHTPGTPSGNLGMGGVGVGVGVGGVGLGGVSVMGPGVSYVPAPAPPPHMLAYGAAMGGGAGAAGVGGGAGQHAPIPAQPPRYRKVGVGSGMQVAAATGQPLLAPAPMQPFVPYPHPHAAPHPSQQALQYQHMVRMYGGSVGAVGVGGVGGVGVGGVGGGEVGFAPPPAPSPAAASPALYPPPSPAHTPHPHPHQHPHPHHHYQQPQFQVLCPLMGPGGGASHHHHHHHLAYLNHAPPTASPPQHPHSIQQVLLPPQHGSSGGSSTPGVHP
ncbi:hypothetical protein K1T71_011476 [Dendrolimus kikuchii]|uniref:Uncharacterized protein n=1 Tax=Dendrolimus kikuchii TaxID=765133 RepID=A0ACC1CNV2_9NEOP|nr:hypothetical protein K1T71_011476 [Dendrolimus kikuchii]